MQNGTRQSIPERASGTERATQRQAFPQFTQMARILHQRGVRFLVGTDLGVPYIFPGFSVHDELALLVKAGLTPMEALEAATANPARALGVADMGPIRIGNIANAVLLDTDPLSDIANTTRSTPSCSAGRY